MKNQYVGDIGDYGKYGLLRFLAERGIQIGVNWYLTKDDGSTDGKFTKYLEISSEAVYDSVVFNELLKHADREDKTVQDIEQAGLIPDALYYHECLPNETLGVRSREIKRTLWFNNSLMLLKDAKLVFADPDNGISYRKKAGDKGSEKYVLPEEIEQYYSRGQNVVFYCHKGRRTAEAWEKTKGGIKEQLPDAQLIVLTFHRGTQRSYIFVLHPDDYAMYESVLAEFLETAWGKVFTREPVFENAEMFLRDAKKIEIECLPQLFSVCKVTDYNGIEMDRPFVFTGRTEKEKSLVCPTELVPANAERWDDGWRALRICGEMDFSLTGILAGITHVLAVARIGVFSISTYNTDYILTKEENYKRAITSLKRSGYRILNNE